jgi:5'(3')-deoxyribonucleotidase
MNTLKEWKEKMSNKPALAVDVDGVVADLIPVWLRRYNKDYGDNLTRYNILDWDVSRFVVDAAKDTIWEYIQDASLYDEVLPIEFALESVERLREYFNLVFVTDATFGTVGRKLRWLKHHGFFRDGDEYIESKDKSHVSAKFLIDDYIKNVETFVGDGDGVGILFGQEWNRQHILRTKMYFDGWRPIRSYLVEWAVARS